MRVTISLGRVSTLERAMRAVHGMRDPFQDHSLHLTFFATPCQEGWEIHASCESPMLEALALANLQSAEAFLRDVIFGYLRARMRETAGSSRHSSELG